MTQDGLILSESITPDSTTDTNELAFIIPSPENATLVKVFGDGVSRGSNVLL